MTHGRRRDGSDDDRDDGPEESRGLAWLERAEPVILVAIVALIVLLWLFARLLRAPWAGG